VVQLNGEDTTSTRLRFFCLVTVLAEIGGPELPGRQVYNNLDALIQKAFNDLSGGKSGFQDLM
jgi:hypothetical protein